MIVKYNNVNGNHLDRVNQIDIANKRIFHKNKGANILRLLFIFLLSITFAFVLISLSSDSVVATPDLINEQQRKNDSYTKELYSTQNSGRVLRDRNIATALGVGRIMEDTPQGMLLGRRGALTDARRNLLILRQKLLSEQKSGRKDTRQSVSGKIAGVVIHSERVVNNLYFLQVDIPLDKLMEGVIEIEK